MWQGDDHGLWNNNDPRAIQVEGPRDNTMNHIFIFVKSNQQFDLRSYMTQIGATNGSSFYDTWKHFTLIIDKAANSAEFYVEDENYQLIGTKYTSSYTFNDIVYDTNEVYIVVGGQQNNNNITNPNDANHWKGRAKDIQLYTRNGNPPSEYI